MIDSRFEALVNIYRPLISVMKEVRLDFDLKGTPIDERFMALSKVTYKKSFEEGVDKCLGINIMWYD